MKQQKIGWLLIGLIIGILLANHPIIGRYIQTPNGDAAQLSEEQKSVEMIDDVYSILKDEYYNTGNLSLSGMREGGIKGFVAALGDPYTEYFTIEQNKDFTEQLEGNEQFEGIGAAVQKKDEAVQIQEIFKRTPAALAGLRPLDLIIEINDEKTKDMTVSEAVGKIRGPKGTVVKLLIYRPSEKDPAKRAFVVNVTRENVNIPSVSVDVIESDKKKIAYIEIALIGEQTEQLLKQEVGLLKDQKIDGVVLDLRGNGGGYLPVAVEIASHFIPKDKIIVTGRYSILPTEQFVSKGYGDFENVPVVILQDALTASAGEIIAGAMRQQRQTPLIGTVTYGKGSIQTVTEIGSGAGLKYTIGKWYLPDDSNIDHEGIKPDVEIGFDVEKFQKDGVDIQKDKAIEELKKLMK